MFILLLLLFYYYYSIIFRLTSGCDNTLFHYVNMECADGVFICPTQYELNQVTTVTHNQLLSNFHTACLSIRALFKKSQVLEQCKLILIVVEDVDIGPLC